MATLAGKSRDVHTPKPDWKPAGQLDPAGDEPGPFIVPISEDEPTRKQNVWWFWLVCWADACEFRTVITVGGCQRHEQNKAHAYLRHRLKEKGVRRFKVCEVIRPLDDELRRVIDRFNRELKQLQRS